ncbi:MAG: RNA ligase [Euryarchaeota archaeon]|nr:RNA ligase [Euryarchaeota archaeon]
MNLSLISEKLGMPEWRLRGAIKRHSVQVFSYSGMEMLLFRKDVGSVERGTVVFGEEVVRGYPKIKRALVLRAAVAAWGAERVAVEEKLNGYNVRVALVAGSPVAVTRGGHVCPYTTARLAESEGIRSFLGENPEYMLCGEVVGSSNPYVVHRYREAGSFGFFVFDVRHRETNEPLSVPERQRLLAEHGLPGVPLLGVFPKDEVAERVLELVEVLEREGREGVVLKDYEMVEEPLKYTPSATNLSDLRHAFAYPYDYGRDFFFSRILREAYIAVERGLSGEELERAASELGKSILLPMVESIRRVEKGEVLGESYELEFRSEDELLQLLEFLRRQGVSVQVELMEDGRKARLKKLRHASTDRIRAVLKSGT